MKVLIEACLFTAVKSQVWAIIFCTRSKGQTDGNVKRILLRQATHNAGQACALDAVNFALTYDVH